MVDGFIYNGFSSGEIRKSLFDPSVGTRYAKKYGATDALTPYK